MRSGGGGGGGRDSSRQIHKLRLFCIMVTCLFWGGFCGNQRRIGGFKPQINDIPSLDL